MVNTKKFKGEDVSVPLAVNASNIIIYSADNTSVFFLNLANETL